MPDAEPAEEAGDARRGRAVLNDGAWGAGGRRLWSAVASAAILARGLVDFVREGDAHVGATDFRTFYMAGRMVRAGAGDHLASMSHQFAFQRETFPALVDPERTMAFMNPSGVALIPAAVAGLPVGAAFVVWLCGEAVLLFLLLSAGIRALGATARGSLRGLAVVVTFPPVLWALSQGQLSYVLALAFLKAWERLRDGNEVAAGLWLSLLLVKPQLVAAPALALLGWRRFRALSGLAAGAALLLALSLGVSGPRGLAANAALLREAATWHGRYTVEPRIMPCARGLASFVAAGDVPLETALWAGAVASVAVVAAAALRGGSRAPARGEAHPGGARSSARERPERFDLEWALVVLAAAFATPYLNPHDLAILVVPGILVCRSLGRGGEVPVSGSPALRRAVLSLPFVGWATLLLATLGSRPGDGPAIRGIVAIEACAILLGAALLRAKGAPASVAS